MRRTRVVALCAIASVSCLAALCGCTAARVPPVAQPASVPASIATVSAPAWADIPVPWQREASTDAALLAAIRDTSIRYLESLATGDAGEFKALSAPGATLARQRTAAFGDGRVPEVSSVSVSDQAVFGNGVDAAAGSGALWIARVTFRERGRSADATANIGLVGIMHAPNTLAVTRVVRLDSGQ